MTLKKWRWPELQASYSKQSPSHVEEYGRGYAEFFREITLSETPISIFARYKKLAVCKTVLS